MNPKWEEAIVSYDRLLASFDAYKANLSGAFTPDQVQYASETRKRLWQMRWITEKIRDLHGAAHAAHAQVAFTAFADTKAADALLEEAMHLTDILELFTENFYLIGFRAMLSARNLPGLKNFDAKGVRDVRNHIIQHPEGVSGIVNQQFSVGTIDGDGPRLKGSPLGEEQYLDQGLLANAMQFSANLTNRLNSAT